MDWAILPPEINSARMYTGPGSGPLLSAAAGWTSLSTSLTEAAASHTAVMAGLSTAWSGPSSTAMATSMAKMNSWFMETSALAAQSATQASAAAAAYEEAYALTVPPSVIAANRTQLASLVATNFLGVNTPAIMTTESQYMEMWAQDASAMSTYQTTSQSATAGLPMFTPSTATADPATAASGATAASPGGVLQTLNSLFSFMNNSNDVFGPNANLWNTLASGGLSPATLAPVLGQLALMNQSNELTAEGNRISEELAHDDESQIPGPKIVNPAESPTNPENSPRAAERPNLALGRAGTAGQLSVPPNWDKTTQQVKLASAAEPLPAGGGGMIPTPIAAVNPPQKEKKKAEEILVNLRIVPPKGI